MNNSKFILCEWYNGEKIETIANKTKITREEIKYFIQEHEKYLLQEKKEKIRKTQDGFTNWIDLITSTTLKQIRK